YRVLLIVDITYGRGTVQKELSLEANLNYEIHEGLKCKHSNPEKLGCVHEIMNKWHIPLPANSVDYLIFDPPYGISGSDVWSSTNGDEFGNPIGNGSHKKKLALRKKYGEKPEWGKRRTQFMNEIKSVFPEVQRVL